MTFWEFTAATGKLSEWFSTEDSTFDPSKPPSQDMIDQFKKALH